MSRPLEGMPVAIIGAGVAGLSAGLALSARGARVSIHERSPAIGRDACSWMAGGMLAPFCERDGAEHAVCERGQLALTWWPARVPGVTQAGTLVLALPRDGAELERMAMRTRDHAWVDGEGIAALEPDLAGRFRRGLWFANEAHLDPRKALLAAAAAIERDGGHIEYDCDVRPDDFDGVPVVDCRGLAACDDLPDLRGVRGEMVILRSRDVRLSRPVRLLHPRTPVYIVPRDDGLLMVGATTVESPDGHPVTVRSAVELLNAAYALHPALADAEIVELGSGVRPAFPDNLPRLVERGRVIAFNGLYRHGFLLSPWYAERLGDRLSARYAEAA